MPLLNTSWEVSHSRKELTMATRRARIKLAPNLGARNKPKLQPVKKVIVTDLSPLRTDTTDTSDNESVKSDQIELTEPIKTVTNDSPKPDVHQSSPVETGTNGIDLPSLTEVVTNGNNLSSPPEVITNSNGTDAVTSPMEVVTNASEVVTNVTDFTVIAKTIDTITEDVTGVNDSDWEDDDFTYKSVEVPMTDNIMECIEITPLDSMNQNPEQIPKDSNQNITSLKSTGLDKGECQLPLKSNSKIRLSGRNKFKPNLSSDRRPKPALPVAKPAIPTPLTIKPASPTPLTAKTMSPAKPSSPAPLTAKQVSPEKDSDSDPDSPPPLPSPKTPDRIARSRKTSEPISPPSMDLDRHKLMQRKLDHKKKFLRGVPERRVMTMFDLIYYNPEHGQRMAIEEEEDTPEVGNNTETPEGNQESSVVDPEPDGDAMNDEPDGMPVPQVKVGPNGEIMIDDSSLVLETTEAKKAKDALQNTSIVVETSKTTTNYGTWSKKRRHADWSKKETLRFYRALSVVGSDFSMMESIFKGRRTRQELKLKFKKEEKMNNKMIDKCLKEKMMYTELEGLMEDSKEDTEEEQEPPVVVKRHKKKRRPARQRYRNPGYYDSSSGEEYEDEVVTKSPGRKRRKMSPEVRKKQPEIVRIKRPSVMDQQMTLNIRHSIPKPSTSSNTGVVTTSLSGLTGSLTMSQAGLSVSNSSLAGVQFPPGLLAANPGLAGAKPGSLVLVASPSKTDPNSQLLQVYMVSNKTSGDGTRERSTSPRVSTPRSPAPNLTLDPAVIRAVDRSRLRTLSGGSSDGSLPSPGRSRTMSESTHQIGAVSSQPVGSDSKRPPQIGRQRTYSEGSGGDLRTQVIRKRFLSTSSRSGSGIESSEEIPIPTLPVARKSKPEEVRKDIK